MDIGKSSKCYNEEYNCTNIITCGLTELGIIFFFLIFFLINHNYKFEQVYEEIVLFIYLF